ncbi:Plasmodium exported protein, unknown function, pseudogene [Plasmodium ovale curtisi]|uniref:Plasmodium RESA N-terminal domain-containing protein n=1 Tax=Plasmodium ovale curtisi TaxID=864141 RepID=A0A1A8WT77_PLAOA|nr:Plasmodium exported protein, unknown function, pseudogene [Plasmodium ovale curtisi]SBS99599.1 Plasmodium exported protein, unknown function, pseudogene [Plasmodium ovale curtisi]
MSKGWSGKKSTMCKLSIPLLVLVNIFLLYTIFITKDSAVSELQLRCNYPRNLAETVSPLTNLTINGKNEEGNINKINFPLEIKKLPFGCCESDIFTDLSEKEVDEKINSFGLFISKKKMYFGFFHVRRHQIEYFYKMMNDLWTQFLKLALKNNISEEDIMTIWMECNNGLVADLMYMDYLDHLNFHCYVKKFISRDSISYVNLMNEKIKAWSESVKCIRKNWSKFLVNKILCYASGEKGLAGEQLRTQQPTTQQVENAQEEKSQEENSKTEKVQEEKEEQGKVQEEKEKTEKVQVEKAQEEKAQEEKVQEEKPHEVAQMEEKRENPKSGKEESGSDESEEGSGEEGSEEEGSGEEGSGEEESGEEGSEEEGSGEEESGEKGSGEEESEEGSGEEGSEEEGSGEEGSEEEGSEEEGSGEEGSEEEGSGEEGSGEEGSGEEGSGEEGSEEEGSGEEGSEEEGSGEEGSEEEGSVEEGSEKKESGEEESEEKSKREYGKGKE